MDSELHNSRTSTEVQASQTSIIWRPPTGVLGGIVAEAYERVARLRADRALVETIEREAASAPPAPSFRPALRRPTVSIVAEVKRRSPSKGAINPSMSAGAQASLYVDGGAAAVSVLTEPAHFGGSLDDLRAARASGAGSAPLLSKDFHVDELQLLEARAAGAAAALLIARALSPEVLRRLVAFAMSIDLEPLVEVRTTAELERAVATGARVIGVNNRDLETLKIEPEVGAALLRLVPADCVAIAESGVRGVADVKRAALSGADAVLVGSSISAAPDPKAAVRALANVPRSERGG
jgi:indole-3-glycerol phosphate synthase